MLASFSPPSAVTSSIEPVSLSLAVSGLEGSLAVSLFPLPSSKVSSISVKEVGVLPKLPQTFKKETESSVAFYNEVLSFDYFLRV